MASSFTDLLAYINMDIETAVTLLVLISLGIGLLTNLPVWCGLPIMSVEYFFFIKEEL